MAEKRNVNILIKATDEASRVISNIGDNALPQLARRVAGVAAGFASIGAAERFLRSSIAAAVEADQATKRLEGSLIAQGLATTRLLPKLQDQATALSRVSTASDEAIMGVQQTLIAVGRLRGTALTQATKATLDLAAGLGIDLPAAADMVARAANGSVKAFTRMGVEFRANADDAEKLNTVLSFVQDRFGGMAENELKTTAGAAKQVSKSFDELKESLGNLVISGGGAVSLMQSLTTTLENLNDQANNPKAQGFWKSLAVLINGALGGTMSFANAQVLLTTATAEANAALQKEKDTIDALNNQDDPFGAWAAIAEANAQALADANAKAEELATSLKKVAEAASAARVKKDEGAAFVEDVNLPTPVVSPQQQAAADAARQAFGNETFAKSQEMTEKQKAAWEQIVTVIESAHDGLIQYGEELTLVKTQSEVFAEFMSATFKDALTGAALDFGDAMVEAAFGANVAWSDTIKQILKGLVKAVVQALILKAITTAITGGGGAVAGAGTSLGGGAVGLARGGTVPRRAPGYAGGVVVAASGSAGDVLLKKRGTDTVPAMLTPGEIVVQKSVASQVLTGQAVIGSAGGGRLTAVPGSLSSTPTLSPLRMPARLAPLRSPVLAATGTTPAMPLPAPAPQAAPRPIQIEVNIGQERLSRLVVDALDYDARRSA